MILDVLSGEITLSAFNLVLLSSPGFEYRLHLILIALAEVKVPPPIVVVSSKKDLIKRRINIFWTRLRKYGLSFLIDDFSPSRLNNLFSNEKYFNSNTPIMKSSENIVKIPSYDSFQGIDIIKRLSPDLLVLAGMHILNREVLNIPRIGTLNGHLGWLPDFRGNYTVHWALFKNAPVGVTVHWVDEGIDTGPIVFHKLIKPPTNRHSIEAWVNAAEKEAAQLLALAIRDVMISNIGPKQGIKQNNIKTTLYKYMPPKYQRQLIKILKD